MSGGRPPAPSRPPARTLVPLTAQAAKAAMQPDSTSPCMSAAVSSVSKRLAPRRATQQPVCRHGAAARRLSPHLPARAARRAALVARQCDAAVADEVGGALAHNHGTAQPALRAELALDAIRVLHGPCCPQPEACGRGPGRQQGRQAAHLSQSSSSARLPDSSTPSFPASRANSAALGVSTALLYPACHGGGGGTPHSARGTACGCSSCSMPRRVQASAAHPG